MAGKIDIETLFKSEAYASSFKRGEIVTRTFAESLVDQSKVAAESKANPDQPLVILDNACGTGVISSVLNTEVDVTVKNRWKLTCGDISPAVLAYTEHRMQQEGWENAETKILDAQKPDLPSDCYSHIFSGFGELWLLVP
jgi:ubiquinone/menaquinone biosynthesis C-methylase UbiE